MIYLADENKYCATAGAVELHERLASPKHMTQSEKNERWFDYQEMGSTPSAASLDKNADERSGSDSIGAAACQELLLSEVNAYKGTGAAQEREKKNHIHTNKNVSASSTFLNRHTTDEH